MTYNKLVCSTCGADMGLYQADGSVEAVCKTCASKKIKKVRK